ncbi:hypothetical protein J421_3326 [Gemmatirosa kalamazoonensis]|uniref:Uncharacterized protein n=2 Tax=Gemmatirosa kalamazoonensis TaxID=861299 RepID=W0RN46_9BACT|nr:hypothetical protein J421_3326 [Gemmatirosa kalamazoonensis]
MRVPAALLVAVASAGGASSARAQIAVVTSTVQERAAAPGESYVGTIRVLNSSAQPQAVRIYQTDYQFFADGTSHFDAPGSTVRSNARWVTPSTSQLVVPPGADVGLTYVVAVPPGDTLAGTYWSTVMVEGVPNTPNAAPAPGRGQVGVGAVVRYAVQVATHVSGGSRRVSFTGLRAEEQRDSTRALELVVRNDGSRAYRPVLWMELYDESGALVVRKQQDRGLLYPGTSLKQRFELGRLPAGAYKVVLFADTGDEAVYAVPYKLKL